MRVFFSTIAALTALTFGVAAPSGPIAHPFSDGIFKNRNNDLTPSSHLVARQNFGSPNDTNVIHCAFHGPCISSATNWADCLTKYKNITCPTEYNSIVQRCLFDPGFNWFENYAYNLWDCAVCVENGTGSDAFSSRIKSYTDPAAAGTLSIQNFTNQLYHLSNRFNFPVEFPFAVLANHSKADYPWPQYMHENIQPGDNCSTTYLRGAK